MALSRRLLFGKALRLRKRWEFLAVQRQGKRLHGRYLVVIARLTGPDEATRLGITVSRKVGNAVVRNRLKRLIREAFRVQQHDLPASLDIVVVAKRSAVDATLSEIKRELRGTAHSLAHKLGGRRR